MQVGDGFAAVRTVVDDDAEAAGEPEVTRELRGGQQEMPKQGLILGTSFHNTHTTKQSADATVAGIPLGRGGSAEDVARAAVFLAGEYDGFITGATLDINGGVYGC